MRSQTGISRLMAAALVSGGLAAATILASSALRAQTPAPAPAAPAAPQAAPPAPAPAMPAPPPGMIATTEVPFYAEWATSPHANRKAEPFNHWNKEGAIPVECARCHSTP